MSYDYVFVRLKENINHFRDFEENNIAPPLHSIEETKNQLCALYPGMQWSDEGHETWFGTTPSTRSNTIEAWLFTQPCCVLKITRIDQEEAHNIAERLKMTAFDVQSGEIVFLQKV